MKMQFFIKNTSKIHCAGHFWRIFGARR